MNPKPIPGIPKQIDGAFHDTESQKDYEIPGLAAKDFIVLKERLLSINNWKDYCGKASADFKVFTSEGEFSHRNPKTGDYIRIDIPGPGDFKSKGYDWVEITEMSDKYVDNDELESFLIISKPSRSPKSEDGQIAHFYSQESTASFRIARCTNFIRIGIYGRNEKPNFRKKNILNKIRNFLISFGGFSQLTKIEWKCVAESLIDFEK